MYAHKRSQPLFTSNQALSALPRRRVSQARLKIFLACSFLPLSSLLDCQTTQAGLAAPKLPQPGVDLVHNAAPPSVCSSRLSRVSATIRKARAGLLGAGQSPVGQRRNMLYESLQYGPYFLSYFQHSMLYWDKLGGCKYIPLIPCYAVILSRYKYITILRRYKYFSFAQCFPCLWPSLDIQFEGTYAMRHLGMGIWSRWWEILGIRKLFSNRDILYSASIYLHTLIFHCMRTCPIFLTTWTECPYRDHGEMYHR
jgi:hypothetical protein